MDVFIIEVFEGLSSVPGLYVKIHAQTYRTDSAVKKQAEVSEFQAMFCGCPNQPTGHLDGLSGAIIGNRKHRSLSFSVPANNDWLSSKLSITYKRNAVKGTMSSSLVFSDSALSDYCQTKRSRFDRRESLTFIE